ncbi:response regulator transcription factor [Fluviicola sp.]|uniref:response regulator transcription factor n=1 Tax=Fluviicola sp. TaxID=1917219 RepID=UPI0031D2DB12
MKTTTNIALIDDHSLFRQGMISLLKDYPDLHVLIEATNDQKSFDHPAWEKVHILLIEIGMAQENGIETMIKIKQKYPEIRVVVLASNYDTELIFHLTELGANSFILKGKNIENLVEVIRNLHRFGYYHSEEVSKALIEGLQKRNQQTHSLKSNALSHREIEVMKLLCEQYTNREIAEILKLSPRTIDTYRENLFVKTGAKNIVGIVRYAINNHLID